MASDPGMAAGLHREKPAILWRAKTGDEFWYDSPIVHDGIVCSGCEDGKVYGIDAATGEILWVFAAGQQPSLDPGRFLGGLLGGAERYFVSRYPVHDGKRMFFGSDDGYVYALDIEKSSIATSFAPGRSRKLGAT